MFIFHIVSVEKKGPVIQTAASASGLGLGHLLSSPGAESQPEEEMKVTSHVCPQLPQRFPRVLERSELSQKT